VSPRNAPRRRTRSGWLGALGGPMLLISLALAGGMAGCSSSHDPSMSEEAMLSMTAPADPAVDGASGDAATGSSRAGADVPIGVMQLPTQAQVTDAWDARPAYVTALPPEWQAAYAYALARPDVLQWLPCYCGCVAMDHRSNLDCFFRGREVAGSFTYEEHASYCDVCVDTANLASRMLQSGSDIGAVRAAVDATFGDLAPGTDTPMPPA